MALTQTQTDTPTLIPACLHTPDYAEWELVVDSETYLIINEAGAWTLLRQTGAAWQRAWHELGDGSDIDVFLRQHQLTLADA
jgi:hypothetical protein